MSDALVILGGALAFYLLMSGKQSPTYEVSEPPATSTPEPINIVLPNTTRQPENQIVAMSQGSVISQDNKLITFDIPIYKFPEDTIQQTFSKKLDYGSLPPLPDAWNHGFFVIQDGMRVSFEGSTLLFANAWTDHVVKNNFPNISPELREEIRVIYQNRAIEEANLANTRGTLAPIRGFASGFFF